MNNYGPIIIIEDDLEDQEILFDILNELKVKNEIIFFKEGQLALEYLTRTDDEPFLILSDIEMPKLNGMQLREMIYTNENLKTMCIPYLFFSTWAEQKMVIEAYSKSIQGFFIKPHNWDHLKRTIKIIIEYWQECTSPKYIKHPQLTGKYETLHEI